MNLLIKKARFVLLFVFIFGLASLFAFQVWGAEGEFIISGYSAHYQTNETIIINSQKELNLLMHDLMSSKYSDYIPTLSSGSGRPDFGPAVDFNQDIVVGVVGQPHENLCRRTNLTGVERNNENGLTVNLEEVFFKACQLSSLPSFTNPVILIKVKRPVTGVKINMSSKEMAGE